ncbi:hypothetical protein QBC40DRAFT_277171 [Triangularia verruculosa]|uniref:AA1-like domain-containing protein n=1 Tax=Triangularia verruculosa TaxID=2587418 RepID=A0AAN7AUT9_9PEZI|nr:hypothetical protein QBC40DRAFT_277171 [Triangularia verruculosa]
MYLTSALSLALAVLLTGTSASPLFARQTNSDETSCSDTSFKHFQWQASNFDFHASYIFSTPAHQNSWGYASFDLLNPADQSTAHCSAASNQLNDFFYGTVQYSCNDTLRGGSTKFDFNRPTGELRVEQSWTCRDQDPQYPITFTAKGSANFTLECNQEFYQNANWTIGQIYSSRTITCGNVDSAVVPYEISAIA